MTLNLNIPLIRRRAQLELMKIEDNAGRVAEAAGKAAGRAADAAGRTADDAASRASSVRMPSVSIAGAVESARRTLDDARRSLSEGGDRVSSEAQKAAAGAGHIATQAGELGAGLLATADDVGAGVRSAVDDVRSLRITREPKRRDPWPGVALIGGIVAGIAAMFLLDPQDGRRRRALLRDKMGKWSRIAGREVRGKAADLRNRSQGMIHEARSAMGAAESGDEGSDYPAGRSFGATQAGGEPAGSEQGSGESGASMMGQEAIGAAVGAGAPEPGGGEYGDLTHDPGRPNGRETGS